METSKYVRNIIEDVFQVRVSQF